MASTIKVDKLFSESPSGATENILLNDDGTTNLKGNTTVTGTCTATTFSGSGASLTNLPAANLTGNLPAISGASLTNLPASGSPPANRNIFINGDMRIAQKAVSAAATWGKETLDRFYYDKGGTDETPDQERRTLTSSDTGPWAKGFKYCYKVTNGNQSGGVGASDYIRIKTTVEARDIFNSGWEYNNASSKLTVSFWVRSSVAQRFYLILRTEDGTGQNYGIPFTISSANTWQQVTHSIPGHANLTFDDDSGMGIMFQWLAQLGSTWTNDSFTDNAWAAYSSGSQSKNYSGDNNDWYETNDAIFELTGCQLEVADSATDFEFRPFADELARCHRYLYRIQGDTNDFMCTSMAKNGAALYFFVEHPVPMRANPSVTGTNTNVRHFSSSSSDNFGANGLVHSHYNTTGTTSTGQTSTALYYEGANASGGQGGMLQCQADGVKIDFSAEF